MAKPITVEIRIVDLEEFQGLISALAENVNELPAPVVAALQRFSTCDILEHLRHAPQ